MFKRLIRTIVILGALFPSMALALPPTDIDGINSHGDINVTGDVFVSGDMTAATGSVVFDTASGTAMHVNGTNTDNSYIRYNGATSVAGYEVFELLASNASYTKPVLRLDSYGTGNGILGTSYNTSLSDPFVRLTSNSNSNHNVLYGRISGTGGGSVIRADVYNASSGAKAGNFVQYGTGDALSGQISNTGNSNAAVLAFTNGTGAVFEGYASAGASTADWLNLYSSATPSTYFVVDNYSNLTTKGYIDIDTNSATNYSLYAMNAGNGGTVFVENDGSGYGLLIQQDGATEDGLLVNKTSASSGADGIEVRIKDGNGIRLNDNGTGNSEYLLYSQCKNAGCVAGLFYDQTVSADGVNMQYWHNNTGRTYGNEILIESIRGRSVTDTEAVYVKRVSTIKDIATAHDGGYDLQVAEDGALTSYAELDGASASVKIKKKAVFSGEIWSAATQGVTSVGVDADCTFNITNGLITAVECP